MNTTITMFGKDTEIERRLPWGINVGGKALCPDGKVRRLKRIAETADTFFSTPASVTCKGKTVAGYVTVETMGGFTTEMPDDPAVLKFIPYTYRKNHEVFK